MLMLWFQVDLTCDPGNHAVCKARQTDESDDKKCVALENHGKSRRLLEIKNGNPMISLLFYYAWHDVSKWNLVSGFDRFSH
jgi:hypothetical protein